MRCISLILTAAIGAATLAAEPAPDSAPADAPATRPTTAPAPEVPGYRLAWHDEFDGDGPLDAADWNSEQGFVRNHEAQWYQAANARRQGGALVIEARREEAPNPQHDPQSGDWKRARAKAEITSASVTTRGKHEFLYGRVEVRAKIPTACGAWPAIWTLGKNLEWPSCGEIDIMEYYRKGGVPHVLANFAWGTEKRWSAKWKGAAVPFKKFLDRDPRWAEKFHLWRMEWDEKRVALYLDDELLNEVAQSEVKNGSLGQGRNPFQQPHYLLLNLAVGGDNGGAPDLAAFPLRYEIDYVRVYQKAAPNSRTTGE